MEWISVEERLPEFNEFPARECIVTDGIFVSVAMWRPKWEPQIRYGGFEVITPTLHSTVTHWMPLPDPPAQEVNSG